MGMSQIGLLSSVHGGREEERKYRCPKPCRFKLCLVS